MRRPAAVAITGIGVVSPYGLGCEALFKGLSQCDSAIEPLSVFGNPLQQVPLVGQIADVPAVDAPRGVRLSRTDTLAILASRQAGVPLSTEAASRQTCAVIVASTVAGLSDIDPVVVRDPSAYYRRGGLGAASTYCVSHVADAVAAALDLGGPRMGISVACASGAMALAVAAELIVQGQTTVALAGGSDALCPFTLAGFNAIQALDAQACRPFDQARAGLNLGEGAAMLLLEDPAHARARRAPILAWLTGWAFSNDAFHPTAPDEEGHGLALCMRLAMQMAHVRPEEIGYVNAHGTGTRLNDTAEMKAYEQVFSGRTTPVPVSSTKSYIGHTLGAAGAIEAAITLLGLRAGRLFPTLRLTDPVEARSVRLLNGHTRCAPMDVAMSVSAGFGGSDASLVFTIDRECESWQ